MRGGAVKKPSPWSLLVGSIPFIGTCFTVPLWDRVEPMVLGMPFNLFWLTSWVLLTPLCMWVAYYIEVPGNPESSASRQGDGT